MRGSIWMLAAAGISLGFVPAILDDPETSGDATGQAILAVVEPIASVAGILFFAVVMGLLVSVWSSDGF